MTLRAIVVGFLGAVVLLATGPEDDRALERLGVAHADYFEHLDTMILLTRRVPAKGHSWLGYLDCLYHVAKAAEKRLDNGLIERDFARLRCPKLSHFEFCPRRRAKAASPLREAIPREIVRNCCVVSRKRPRLLSWGRKKQYYGSQNAGQKQ